MAVPSLRDATADPMPGRPALTDEVRANVAALTRGEKPDLGLITRPLTPIPLQDFITPVASVAGWHQLLDAIGS